MLFLILTHQLPYFDDIIGKVLSNAFRFAVPSCLQMDGFPSVAQWTSS